MKAVSKVSIDGVDYVPLGSIGIGANPVALAIIRALISDHYTSVYCHVDFGDPKKDCDCSSCRVYRIAVQFLGEKPASQKEGLLEDLWQNERG